MPRHNSVVLISILVHVGAIAAFVLLSILAPGILPIPRDVLAWDAPRMIQVDIPLPPKPRQPKPPEIAPTSTNHNAAPLTQPDGLRPETGHEQVRPETFEPGVVEGTAAGSALQEFAAPPPPPPPPVQEPVRIGGSIQPPKKLVDALPKYPSIAAQAGVQGIVIIEATISETGDVVATKVLRSIPLLDRAAIDAVMQWKYTPVRLNGTPVPVLMTVTVNFALSRP